MTQGGHSFLTYGDGDIINNHIQSSLRNISLSIGSTTAFSIIISSSASWYEWPCLTPLMGGYVINLISKWPMADHYNHLCYMLDIYISPLTISIHHPRVKARCFSLADNGLSPQRCDSVDTNIRPLVILPIKTHTQDKTPQWTTYSYCTIPLWTCEEGQQPVKTCLQLQRMYYVV